MYNFTKSNVTKMLLFMGRMAFLSLFFLITTASVLLATSSYSQHLKEIPVNVDFHHVKLAAVLDTLTAQSGIRFSYPSEMKDRGPVTLRLLHSDMYHALLALSTGLQLRFSRTDGVIAISDAEPPPEEQRGIIKGRIVDFETTAPLPGATVVLLPLNKGMVTDEKGYYQLENIPAGQYQLKVSFIGYQSFIQQVTITGKTLLMDVKLRAAVTLSGVEVKSRVGFSHSPVSFSGDKEVLSEIKAARGIVSGISNEQIVKSADRNAAEIIKRVSGITVVDEKFVQIRGMNPRYNLTYLNDNPAPATEMYNRSFAYDMLPAPVIDKIMVYKSPMAELMGDYAGGAVKVFTKNTRPVRHFDIGAQFGYRDGTTFQHLNTTTHSSTDWLGFDNGMRKLPANLPTYRQSGGHYEMPQQEMVNAFSNDWTYQQQKALPDMQLFLNYFDNWRIGKYRLFNLSSVTYTNESRHQLESRQTGNTYAYMLDKYSVNLGASNTLGINDVSTQTAKFNWLQNFTLQLDSSNRIEWKNFVLNEGKNTVSIQTTQGNIFPDKAVFLNYKEDKQNILQFQQRFLYNSNLGGYHRFGSQAPQEFHWNLGYAYSMQDVPDQRISRFVKNYAPGGLTSGEDDALRWVVNYGVNENQLFNGMLNRFFIKNAENTYNGALEYSIAPLKQLTLKMGAYNMYRTRVVDRRFFKVNRGGLTGNEVSLVYTPGGWDNNGLINPAYLTFREQDLSNIWQPANFKDDGSALQLYDVSTPIDHYVASEQQNSGFIQGEWNAWNGKLIVNGGLRYEHSLQKVSGAAEAQGVYLPVEVNLPQNNLLPSVQISFRPTSKWVFRGSYGRTLNRPELREIAPFSDYDFVNMERISGNTGLKGSSIDNYDVRVELYPGQEGNEMISIGLFAKQIDKPIERLRFSNGNEIYGGQTGISYFNADKASVYGIEAEVRKNLSFIPVNFFRHLSVIMNGALIKSKSSRTFIPDPAIPNPPGAAAGSFDGRPLQGQAPYVFNAGLYYENVGTGTKLGFLYNVSGPSIYAIANGNAEEILKLQAKTEGYTNADLVTLATRPDLLELPRHLFDLSLTQRLYKALQMRINIQNLLDQPFTLVEDQNYNHRYDKERKVLPAATSEKDAGRYYFEGDNIYQKYFSGRYCTLTFTYSF